MEENQRENPKNRATLEEGTKNQQNVLKKKLCGWTTLVSD